MKYYPPRYLFRRHVIMQELDRGERFLEIGPGALHLTREIARYFLEGTIVELNPFVEDLYAQLPPDLKNKIRLLVTDFTTADIGEHFDCVIACEVMEHVEDDARFLSRIFQLVKPGGQLILSVPARKDLWSVDDEYVGHFRRYERSELITLLETHGFCSVRVVSYGFPFTRLFRLPRLFLATRQINSAENWSQKERSQASGVPGIKSTLARLLGVFLNPKTIYPLALLTRWFNNYDLSDGYIAFAKKPLAL